jgi:hypothetical protein
MYRIKLKLIKIKAVGEIWEVCYRHTPLVGESRQRSPYQNHRPFVNLAAAIGELHDDEINIGSRWGGGAVEAAVPGKGRVAGSHMMNMEYLGAGAVKNGKLLYLAVDRSA